MNSRNTRERLLDAARHLAHTKGFDRTSISEITAAADVKKGSLYHHFADKDALSLAVLEEEKTQLLAMLGSALTGTTPLEALETFFRTVLNLHSGIAFIGGCLWGNTALEMSDTKPVLADTVKSVFSEWIDRIEGVISAGQSAQQIRTDIPSGELALMVVAAIEGGIMMARLTKQEAPLKSCLNAIFILIKQQDSSLFTQHNSPDAAQVVT